MDIQCNLEAKSLSIGQRIYVNKDNNDLCDTICDGFVDKTKPPCYDARCRMFLTLHDLSIESIKKDKLGRLTVWFERCRECKEKEIK